MTFMMAMDSIRILDTLDIWLCRPSTWIKLVSVLLYINHHAPSEANTHFIYMTNHCARSVHVGDSLMVVLTANGNLPDDRSGDFLQCDLDITAPKGMKLFVHFLQLSISPAIDHSDRLQLYDVTLNKTRLTPTRGLYGRLDRAGTVSDESGANIRDYRTVGSMLKVQYLGKPTKTTPGFSLIVTPFKDSNGGGECPAKHYHCRRASMCIPREVTCDGNPNCGKDDDGDEDGCDRNDTVTDLLAEYSLTRDIILVIMLPAAVFLGFAVAIFLAAKRRIKQIAGKQDTLSVQFKTDKDGEARITECPEIYNPPSYEDIMELPPGFELPPAYNGCAAILKRGGSLEAVSPEDKEVWSSTVRDITCIQDMTIHNCNMTHSIISASAKCTCVDVCECENSSLACVLPSGTEDGPDKKERRSRKGGKGKLKRKPEDDLENTITERNVLSFDSQGELTFINNSTNFVPSCSRLVASVDTANLCNSSALLCQTLPY